MVDHGGMTVRLTDPNRGRGMAIGAASSSPPPPPPAPVANITFSGNGTATIALDSSTSTGTITSQLWTISQTLDPVGDFEPPYALDAGSPAWLGSEGWTGTNPGENTQVDPTVTAAPAFEIPLGGYSVTLTVTGPNGTSDPASLYLAVGNSDGDTPTITAATVKGGLITGNVTSGEVTSPESGVIEVPDVGSLPANAIGSAIVAISSGFAAFRHVNNGGTVTFSDLQSGTYSVYAYGFNHGENGPVATLGSEIEVD